MHAASFAPRTARHAHPQRKLALPPDLRAPDQLWAHQAEAIDCLRSGRHIVLATPTASGKSLAYQLPVVESVGSPVAPATALMVFPTKALAHDQLRSLTELAAGAVTAVTYDGDSSPEERAFARTHGNVILTNPEMLHHGMLPNHKRWALYLSRLQFVVIDELHVLRGVFGAHVGQVLRRLQRLCAHYGAHPRFVFCSATIGEPGRLAGEILGQPVVEITDDGSPAPARHVALWDPTAHDGDDPGEAPSQSTNAATSDVAASLVDRGLRTLVFTRSRRGAELVAQQLRRRLDDGDGRVRAYRAGYLADERREIEDALVNGRLDAVVATNALELGVDIGGLDAVVLSGFPGTVASMWQQIGRAGRSHSDSIAVLVAGDDQLDRWVMDHPAETLRRPPERAVTNLANPLVADAHLACAAHERPLEAVDRQYWDDVLDDGVRRGVTGDWLALRRRRHGQVAAVWSGRGWPGAGLGLRSSSRGEFRILDDDDDLIGTIDSARVFDQAHTGAVYLHQGAHWRVNELDLDEHRVRVEPGDGTTYTQARSSTTIRLLDVEDSRDVGRTRLHRGSVEVTRQVTGYQEKRVSDHRVIERVDLDLPPATLSTRAFWYTVDPELLAAAEVAPKSVPGTLHAVEHAAIGMLPLFAICDRWDVGGISSEWLEDTSLPSIVIYDAYAGGAGIAELGWEAADRHLAATLGMIERCSCESGCPSCVQSPKCGNWNEPLDKAGASSLLRASLYR